MSRALLRSDLVKTPPLWLLTIRYAGQEVRFSTYPVEIIDTDGRIRNFGGGLGDPGLADGFSLFDSDASVRSAPFSLVFPGTVDVPLLESQGHDLGAATGELALWSPGTAWESRQVVIDGRVIQPEYATADDPVTFSLEEAPYNDRSLIPESTAIVSSATWSTPHDSAIGLYYPEVIGAPGRYVDSSGTAQTVPGSPALIVDWDTVTSPNEVDKLLIAGHRVAATSVTVFNAAGTSWVSGVTHEADGLGRTVATVDITAQAAADRQDSSQYWIGWHSGGGRLNADESAALTGAGEVLAYYLNRSSVRVDAGRTATTAGLINDYKVSTYTDAPISPWELVRRFVLPWVPVTITTGQGGLYPVVWRYWATAADAVESIDADTPGIVRRGNVRRDRDARTVINEIRVEWAYDPNEKSAKRVTTVKPVPSISAGEYTSQHVQHSARRYGDAAQTWKAYETCDGPTAARVSDWLSRAYSGVPRVVTYDCPAEYGWLEPGSVVTVTEAAIHLSTELGLVTERQWTATGVRLTISMLYDPGERRWST